MCGKGTLYNSQTHKSWTDQWEPRIIFLHKIWNVCQEKLQIHVLYYAIIPLLLSHIFCLKSVLVLLIIIFYSSSSHFCSDKPRTAYNIRKQYDICTISLLSLFFYFLRHIMKSIFFYKNDYDANTRMKTKVEDCEGDWPSVANCMVGRSLYILLFILVQPL